MPTGKSGAEGALGSVLMQQVEVIASEMQAVAHELNAALVKVAPEGAAELGAGRADEALHEMRSVSAPLENLTAPMRQLEVAGRIGPG